MMKRMMFLAAGVIASLAFTASARANTVFMVDSTVEVLSGTATTVTDTFSGPVSSFDGYLSGTSPTPVSETMSGNTIKFTYSPGLVRYPQLPDQLHELNLAIQWYYAVSRREWRRLWYGNRSSRTRLAGSSRHRHDQLPGLPTALQA